MICPKCRKQMVVRNSFHAGNLSRTQTLECSDKLCGTTFTALTTVVAIDPGYGDGAKALAKNIRENKVKVPKIKVLK